MTSFDKDIGSCETCRHYSTGLADIATIAVTYWNRPAALARLRKSLATMMPDVRAIVEDTGGNLSAGRNRLYARVDTPYVVVMEEDFVALPETAQGLRDAAAILAHDPAIAGVGGMAMEPERGWVRWGHNFNRNGTICKPAASWRPLRETPDGIKYRPCDLVLNWGLFRTDLFRSLKWPEDLPVQEHQAFFWTAKQAGYQFAFYHPLHIRHLRDRPNETYKAGRNRRFSHVIRNKLGFNFASDA